MVVWLTFAYDFSCEQADMCKEESCGGVGIGGLGNPWKAPTSADPGEGSPPPLSSALAHTDRAGSLSSLARIEAAKAFQTNGLGSALCSARYRLMAACRSTIE